MEVLIAKSGLVWATYGTRWDTVQDGRDTRGDHWKSIVRCKPLPHHICVRVRVRVHTVPFENSLRAALCWLTIALDHFP